MLHGFGDDPLHAAAAHGHEQRGGGKQATNPPTIARCVGRRRADAGGVPAFDVVGPGTHRFGPDQNLPWTLDVAAGPQLVLPRGGRDAAGCAVRRGHVDAVEFPVHRFVDVGHEAQGGLVRQHGVHDEHGGQEQLHAMTVKLVP